MPRKAALRGSPQPALSFQFNYTVWFGEPPSLSALVLSRLLARFVPLPVAPDLRDRAPRPAPHTGVHAAPHPRPAAALVVEYPPAVRASLDPKEGVVIDVARHGGQHPACEACLWPGLVPDRHTPVLDHAGHQWIPPEPPVECLRPAFWGA